MYLSKATLDVAPTQLSGYLGDLPLVRALGRRPLKLRCPVTILSGENGSGKSTLIEALAVGMGANPEGGSRHTRLTTLREPVSGLHRALTLTRRRNPGDLFFLRGESFHRYAQYHDGLEPAPHEGADKKMLLDRSHGQSLMMLNGNRFHGSGLFFLDEPEAGLSVLRQLKLMGRLYHLATAGSQIIMATHSPVLLAVPGAELLELDGEGFHPREFEDTEAVRSMREFIADPAGTAAFLTGWNGS